MWSRAVASSRRTLRMPILTHKRERLLHNKNYIRQYILRAGAIVWSLFAVCLLYAQTTITSVDGRRAYYDSLSGTYLISVPEDYEPSALPDSLNVETTLLPILRLTGEFSRKYSQGTLELTLPTDTTTVYTLEAKYRGGTTNSDDRHKRNFHLHLLDEKGKKDNRYLLSLRKDDSFLLDAGQVDLGRIRNHVAHEIWRDMGNAPYYAEAEPEAKNYINCEFVELFVNDEYFGLYSLTEAMDRKQLKLVKYDKGTLDIHGILYKGISWDYTMMYGPFDEPDNNSGSWGGFDVKYPSIDEVCPTNWDLLYDAIIFVDESSTRVYSANVDTYFDIPILINYYLFHTVLGTTDHGGKNIYWACYDTQLSPMLTLAIWDYDTIIGQLWNNAEVHSTSQGPEQGNIFSKANPNVIYRLVKGNINNFFDKAVERYWELRPTVFDPDNLANRFNDYYDYLRLSGTLAREERRWSGDSDIIGLPLDFSDEQEYINDWLHRRIAYLDELFFIGAGIEDVSNISPTDGALYNLSGQRVGDSYKGIVVSKGRKILK